MEIVSCLYSCVGLISLAGFVPQIWTLARSSGPCTETPLKTWLMWMTSWAISLTYGVIVLHDMLFIATAMVSFSCHFCVVCLIIYKRWRAKESVLEIPHINQVPSNSRASGHSRRHKVRSASPALPSLKVAV